MILVDTGPFVALFDPKDHDHHACHTVLSEITDPLYTTEAVLTEVFHMLAPESRGAAGVREFLLSGFAALVSLDREGLERAFGLMEMYADLPMDFADATIVVAAETLQTRSVFTLDVGNFSTYRLRKGHRQVPIQMIGADVLQPGKR